MRSTEGETAAYIKEFMRQYAWALERFFQGYVISFSGSAGNYLVRLRRIGESAWDGNTYQCAPTYTPTIGDRVECIWRDQITAYVLWKLP